MLRSLAAALIALFRPTLLRADSKKKKKTIKREKIRHRTVDFLGIMMRSLELRGRRYIKTYAMDIIRQGNLSENSGEIVVYQPDEITRLEVRLQDETVWLNRQQLATLFGRDVKTIGKHINNALAEELKDIPTIANFATVQIEGSRYVTRDIE